MEWISVNDRLPEIDLHKLKSSIKVKIKNFEKNEATAYFRHVVNSDGEVYGIFYNLKNGKIYKDISEWMPLPEPPKQEPSHETKDDL